MSGRTIPRFALVGLLAAAFAAPAVAQVQVHAEEEIFQVEGRPVQLAEAPMPRAKAKRPDLRDFAKYDVTGLGLRMPDPVPPELPVPPMVAPTPPVLPVSETPGTRLAVPALGPLSLWLDVELPQSPHTDNRHLFNFSTGLFGEGGLYGPPATLPAPPRPSSFTGGFGSYCAPAIPRLVAPPPAQPGSFVIGIAGIERPMSCVVPLGSPQLQKCEPMTWTLPTAPPVQVQRHATIVKVIEVDCVKACPANALSGTWYREMPGMVISATFTHDELKLCMTQCADGHTATVTITAQYTVTKDGLVYGAITGADADMTRDPKTGESPFDDRLAELMTGLQEAVDAPFSFRTKMTSAGLMVSGVKSGTQMTKGETGVFGGMFKPAKDGRVPTPVSVKTSKADAPPVGAVVGGVAGPATGARIGDWAGRPVPATPDCQRVGIDFNTNPPTMLPPQAPGGTLVPILPPCATPQPVKPVGCGIPADGTKQLATEAFGQLLQQSGMTLPSGRYLEHYPQYYSPDPAFPLPRELASQEDPVGAARRAGGPVLGGASAHTTYIPTPATPSFVGTWYRDVAGKRCVVKVATDHLTLTVSEAHEENGKVSTASLVITADYHLTRDGLTAVGLITSVDVSFEGEFPQEDSKPFFEMLSELQKALEDKPFALTFRSYGDALVISNVRMPAVSDRMEVQPAGYMAGRYKAAGAQMPKPKAIKVSAEPKSLPTPSIYGTPAGKPVEEYTLPPGELLLPQTIPSPRVIPSSGTWTPAVPSMTEPTPPPVRRMPEPIPPAVSLKEEPKPATSKVLIPGLMYANANDPNIRMQRLLYESEDLRQLKNEWRRFWFNDQPSHLTPERIHGGIY